MPPRLLSVNAIALTAAVGVSALVASSALGQSDGGSSSSVYDSLTFATPKPAPPAEPTPGSLYKSLTFEPAKPKAPSRLDQLLDLSPSAQPVPVARPAIGLPAIEAQKAAGTYKPFDPASFQAPPPSSPQAPAASAKPRPAVCDGLKALTDAADGGFKAVEGAERRGVLTSWESTVTPAGASGCTIMGGAAGRFVSCRFGTMDPGPARARWQSLGDEVDACVPGWGDEVRTPGEVDEPARVFVSGFGGPTVEVLVSRSVVHDGQWDVSVRINEHGL